MALEENLERELIPLVFNEMYFDGSWSCKRLDTGEIVDVKYVEVLCKEIDIWFNCKPPIKEINQIKERIKMSPPLKMANGLLIQDWDKDESGLITNYTAIYCEIDEKALQKKETDSSLGGGFSIE